ncbi:MAG: diguanylate cyclase [Bacteroidales bacterium]|nr:diguanylate cyclase [Bacteroidales bacterium]
MTLSQLSIPRKSDRDPALDHRKLYEQGLSYAQELSRQIWTDYNVHDPGITILELLCYALTDLGYRASFPIRDLVSDPANPNKPRGLFYTARSIFPNTALTNQDYRKLIIDSPGIRNAWLKPHSLSYFADGFRGELLATDPGLPGIEEVPIHGLYDVTLEYESNVLSPEQKEAIKQTVRELLNANRNLCEDFVDISDIEVQVFNLCAEIELYPNADASAVKAAVYQRIQNYLSPEVRFYSLGEMLKRRKSGDNFYSTDEIFEGPLLNHGFIDNNELEQSELRESIRLSDLISEVMDIPGVLAVREMRIVPAIPAEDYVPTSGSSWVIPVEPGKKASLSIDFLDDNYHLIKFFKHNMPVFPRLDSVMESLKQLSVPSKSESYIPEDLPVPAGRYRNPDSYYSFQNHFPAIYGLTDAGLDSSATDSRKALSYQLKAYLLFFDQLMAGYFAQLGKAADLLSADPELHRTYFQQTVSSFKEYQKIYGVEETSIQGKLDEVLDLGSNHPERRNRFLDHLIARFAERFHDYASIVHEALGSSAESIAAVKSEFLSSYETNSSQRSKAYNYSLSADTDLWDSSNISGLENRIGKLLGMRNLLRRDLSEFQFTIYAEIDSTPGDEFRFRIRHSESGKIILSSSTHYSTEELARAEMRRALKAAMLPASYQRKVTIDERFYFNIVDGSGEVIARRIEYFATTELMNQAIDSLIFYLQEQFSEEGFYLIENILLRPEPDSTDPFLPICKAEQQTSCSDFDPYSYRLHFILPAENGRFRNMQFRRFAEQVIREETPAHILTKICWISKEDISLIEKAYKDWLYLKSGRDETNREEKLKALIKALYEVKNIYPSQLLKDCSNNESQFILGSTALGSFEKE